MKPAPFHLVRPDTLGDALAALAGSDGDVRPLAGGQSLVPIMNFRLATPSVLVDLRRVEALRGIGLDDDGALRVGSMTTHRDIETSGLVRSTLPLLPAAMEFVAHVQIRNRGTIGGSLAHCDPSAEWPALALALDARIEVASERGHRHIPAEAFSLDVFSTALEPDEIITAIVFPARSWRHSWGFKEVSRRLGDFAMAGACCVAEPGEDERIAALRLVVFGVENRPRLIRLDHLADQRPDAGLIADASRRAVEAVEEPRSDFHASDEYRLELVEVVARRSLIQAFAGWGAPLQ